MVEEAAEEGSMIEIRSGLQPSEVVVITGAFLLDSEYIFKKSFNPIHCNCYLCVAYLIRHKRK